ncbi:hypothetical protein R1sor_024602 [Riccia sorocarpa]|uniref:Uncharacterized protein n=1 Tax=Riccia sorocarpa TaxID=122646 RepID=A0ABD3GSV1_9MARC
MDPAEKLSDVNVNWKEQEPMDNGFAEHSFNDDNDDEEPALPAKVTQNFMVTDLLSAGPEHHGVFHYTWDVIRGDKRWKKGLSYSDRIADIMDANNTWQAKLSVICLKILFNIYGPMKALGHLLEDILNLFVANGGVFSTFYHMFFPLAWPNAVVFPGTVVFTADVLVMASKIVYENGNYIERCVGKIWKMIFVGFWDCWNGEDIKLLLCSRLTIERLAESSRLRSDEERGEMRRESIQITEAVEELLRTEPKLRDLTALQKDWIRASFVHMYWELLDPVVALPLNASKEDHLRQLRLVLEGVRIMRSIDPGSQHTVQMLREAYNQTTKWKIHRKLFACTEIEILLRAVCGGVLDIGLGVMGFRLEPEHRPTTISQFL